MHYFENRKQNYPVIRNFILWAYKVHHFQMTVISGENEGNEPCMQLTQTQPSTDTYPR